MARILISEPHPDVRRLLERMVARLGHEPMSMRIPTPEDLTSGDVFILEPTDHVAAAFAQSASLAAPSLPLICASVAAPAEVLAELGVEFVACIVKPFTLDQLDGAIRQALAVGRARPRRPHCGEDPCEHRVA